MVRVRCESLCELFPFDIDIRPSICHPRPTHAIFRVVTVSLCFTQLEKPYVLSKPSHGQLDLNFKFGGPPLSSKPADASWLTLSDIIPSPVHACSLSLSSALGNDSPQQLEAAIPAAKGAATLDSSMRRQSHSNSSSTRSMHEDSGGDAYSSHSRASSQASFRGFESFNEIQRGFEFVDNRPAFYPPPFNSGHHQQPWDSMMSITSVSSYGFVLNPLHMYSYFVSHPPSSPLMSTPLRWSHTSNLHNVHV
jgi:serine/arginine repetitive matrix protein 2